MSKCTFCGEDLSHTHYCNDTRCHCVKYTCLGTFTIPTLNAVEFNNNQITNINPQKTAEELTAALRYYIYHKALAWNKQDKDANLTHEEITQVLKKCYIPKIPKRKELIIEYIGDNTGIGFGIDINEYVQEKHALKLKAFSGCINDADLFMLAESLYNNQYLSLNLKQMKIFNHGLYLTELGWQVYEQIKSSKTNNKQAFMAMSFGSEKDGSDKTQRNFFEETLKPAIAATGFSISRVDDNFRAGLIDNTLLDDISSARFMVADLTHGNQGVYWEAGYAEALEIPVIYICQKDAKPHFDVRNRNTIIFSDNKDLKNKLQKAIESCFPDASLIEQE